MKLFVDRNGIHGAIGSVMKFFALLLTVSVLTACGGGGGGSAGTLGEDQGSTDNGGATGGGDDGEGVVDDVVRIGFGTGDAFEEGVIGVDDLNLGAGASTTLTINFVDSDGDPINTAQTVTLSSACVAMGLSTLSTEALTTTTSGFGTVTYTANGCSGDDLITATADSTGEVALATVTIEPDTVLSVEFVGATSTNLSLAGVGGDQTTTLTFRLVGAQGANIVGESVTFTTDAQNVGENSGGARIAEGSETDVSSSDGTISTVLQAGTNAGNVRVIATHDATLVSAQSDSIVIASGLPIQSAFSISFTNNSPPSSSFTDGSQVEVNILASDQFGNRIAPGTQVNFFAECGTVESSCSIDDDGGCSVTWLSNTASQASAGDNRCSILAFTEGVETFVDVNANSVYENVDIFTTDDDLPEPFVDFNESGDYDFGERFVDRGVGTANTYDFGNGEWDGLCLIDLVPTANCDGDDTSLIFNQGVITLASRDVVLIPDFDTVPGSVIFTVASTIVATSSPLGTGFINPPAAGTSISVSGNDVELFGGTSFTVPETLSVPFVTSAIGFAIDDVNPSLEVTVNVAGGDNLTFLIGL